MFCLGRLSAYLYHRVSDPEDRRGKPALAGLVANPICFSTLGLSATSWHTYTTLPVFALSFVKDTHHRLKFYMDALPLLELIPTSEGPITSDLYSDIYRGRLGNGTVVALKIVGTRPYIDDAEGQERMRDVLNIWADCIHPHIVQLVRQAALLGQPTAVYEWHEYGSILEYLQLYRDADSYRLSTQICEGLLYLHQNEIIHGSLRGDQILVSGDGVPRILLSVVGSSTVESAVEGYSDMRWGAPELLEEGVERTLASDVYSLAMETITRRIPYADITSRSELREKIAAGVLPSGSSYFSTTPVLWDTLCECWSRNSEDRPLAEYVRDIMLMIRDDQDQDDTALSASRIVVGENTHVQELVEYYERSDLKNYTELLEQSGIATATPFADTALANVYRVTLPNQQCVAVKFMKHNLAHKRLKRAARELSCWSSSHTHRNILSVLGFAVIKGDLAMISPWMENGCITDYIKNNPNANRMLLCGELARAIAYLHKHDVVHGDIKSPNVLVSDKGRVKVMDFGVSIMDHNEIEFSVTSGAHGTQRWQAPEVLLGNTDSTKEGDMYALGMTLTEIYTGERPYGSMDWNGQTMIRVINGQLRPGRPIGLPLDDGGNKLWELMKQCWVGEPDMRLTSYEAFITIYNILDGEI